MARRSSNDATKIPEGAEPGTAPSTQEAPTARRGLFPFQGSRLAIVARAAARPSSLGGPHDAPLPKAEKPLRYDAAAGMRIR